MTQRIKSFDDLTDAEVLALTDEQIERYIDIECAIKGVPLLPPEPPAKPEPVNVEKDVTLYAVGGFHFFTESDALTVSALLNGMRRAKLDYAPNGDYRNRVVSVDEDDVAAQAERHFSTEQYRAARETLQANEYAAQEYDRIKRGYDEDARKRREATQDVRDRIEYLRERQYRREHLQYHFQRYVELADGDKRVAARFLANAHGDALELLPDLYVEAAEEAVSA